MKPPVSGALGALPLRLIDDRTDFAQVDTLDALLSPDLTEGGLRWLREDYRTVDPDSLAAWRSGRIGGGAASRWDQGRNLGLGETELRRVGPSWWHPAGGALIGLDGALPAATVAEIYFNKPDLSPLTAVAPGAGGLQFTPPNDAPSMDEVCVAFPWGVVNYGHFLLDGLTGVLALFEAGAIDRRPLATPPLRRWQRELLRLAFDDLAWQEIAAPIVRVAGAVYTPAMDHYLHRPGPLLVDLRERLLAAAARLDGARNGGRRRPRKRKLYVSRRGQPMRTMVNEAALEVALLRRGFHIVRPEAMSVAEQIRLFGEADVIVGPTGAAFANAILAPIGCKLVEIQPENFASFWVPAFSRLIGLDWSGYIAPSPCDPKLANWRARLRRGFHFAYHLDLADVLAFLDARL